MKRQVDGFMEPSGELRAARVSGGLLTLALLLVACARAPVVVGREAGEPEVARAEQAFGALRARLLTRVSEAVGQSGPAGAIAVCNVEAAGLTAEIATAQHLELGRTSFKLRNPANAPRPWAAKHVTAAQPHAAYFDLGDRVGVLQPMPLGAVCLGCHGATLAPEVTAALSEKYPGDRATGFAEGDLRGYFWAEVPKG